MKNSNYKQDKPAKKGYTIKLDVEVIEMLREYPTEVIRLMLNSFAGSYAETFANSDRLIIEMDKARLLAERDAHIEAVANIDKIIDDYDKRLELIATAEDKWVHLMEDCWLTVRDSYKAGLIKSPIDVRDFFREVDVDNIKLGGYCIKKANAERDAISDDDDNINWSKLIGYIEDVTSD